MRELALFAGAGGGILGGKLLGWRTVCACELNPYCRAVLLARQRDGIFDPFPIWDDIRTFDGLPWRGAVDVVSGGFPCQDISALGKGAGIDGPKSGLWREMARIIGEVRPRFAFVENSPMLVQRGLARVLGDLAELRFDARWGIMGADEVGAPHICKRIWLVAFAAAAPDGGHEDVGDADRIGCQQSLQTQHGTPTHESWTPGDAALGTPLPAIWHGDHPQPGILGMDDGLADWKHRVKALGNGQVPSVAARAWHMLTSDPNLFTIPASVLRTGAARDEITIPDDTTQLSLFPEAIHE